ncbi:MAG: cytochrome d ubiquinol oxidase subunit II [Acidobacteria bacterium]|nr:cytochrome d ubiquinol oxidase subunit II [Acidobacteriota bacterium]
MDTNTLQILWFCLVAVMLTFYVILDGFDIGAGIVSLLIGRDQTRRALVLKSIGPFWDGNEVWLLAGGGCLYSAFPTLYASSFQGFYLPLMMVLWLLMLRGISIELRNHIVSDLWRPLWDKVFGVASALLAIFYGAALGNVVRGVPLDSQAEFFLPLWTNWQPGADPGILDWYTVLVGLLAFATLTMHGALWVKLKTEGALANDSRTLARLAAAVALLLTGAVTVASFSLQPQIVRSFTTQPAGLIFPALAVVGLGIVFLKQGDVTQFLGSCVFILGMMTSAAFGLFPYVLPSSTQPSLGLTIQNTAAANYGLGVGLWWWTPGMLLAGAYTWFLYRRFAGKVQLDSTH